MLVKALTNQRAQLTSSSFRLFSYSDREIKRLEQEFNRKFNAIRMHTEQKEFNYEQPQMIYDKKTCDVRIIDMSKGAKKNIIRNMDDLERERAAIMKEVDKLKTQESKAEKLAALELKFRTDWDVDPS